MRQRHVKGIDEKLAAYADLILPCSSQTAMSCAAVEHLFVGLNNSEKADGYPSVQLLPSGRPVRWYQRSSPRYIFPEGYERTYVEFGCGRGHFINEMAAKDLEALYIGVEGCKTVVVKALAKTRAAGFANIRYIDAFINDADAAFEEGSLDGVFLNFSDPWPKERHASRRLTAPEKACAYLRILKPGGIAVFKTDSEKFFKYSITSFIEAGFKIVDLSNEVADRAVSTPTEYELRFRSLGQPVYHFKALKYLEIP